MTVAAGVGIGLLVTAMILMWMSKRRSHRRAYFVLTVACLALVGVLDLYLIMTGQDTVTHNIQAGFSMWARAVVMLVLVVHTWVTLGWRYIIPVSLAVIWGHLFWT